MKNVSVLLLILSVCLTTHTMEQNNQLALPDWKSVHSQLVADYKDILKVKLEEYREADVATWTTAEKAKELSTIGAAITNYHVYELESIVGSTIDAHANTFLHYAVARKDAATVERLLFHGYNTQNVFAKNSNGETPFDLCIKNLLPSISSDQADQTAASKQIFKTIVRDASSLYFYNRIAKKRVSDEAIWYRTDSEGIDCLKKIIDLQLKHARAGSDFSAYSKGLKKFVIRNRASEEEKKAGEETLALYYRQACDQNGYTFTRALIDNPDALFELAKKNYVSFEKNIFIFAKTRLFRAKFKYEDGETEALDDFQKASCVVYILLNHAKALAQKGAQKISDEDIADFGPCCDKHII